MNTAAARRSIYRLWLIYLAAFTALVCVSIVNNFGIVHLMPVHIEEETFPNNPLTDPETFG